MVSLEVLRPDDDVIGGATKGKLSKKTHNFKLLLQFYKTHRPIVLDLEFLLPFPFHFYL